MSSKADIWMPLFIGDYLADTSRLTTEQHGAYMLLIMDYWRNGPPPDDDEVLANISKASAQAWKKIKPTIAEKFKIAAGKWTHGRIDRELLLAEECHGKATKKARQGADARWSKQRNEDVPSIATGNAPSITTSTASGYAQSIATGNAIEHSLELEPSNAHAMLKQCPSQSQSTSTSKTKKKPSQNQGTAFAVPYGISQEIWDSYLKTRTKRRASNDPVALALVVEKLETLRLRGHDPQTLLCNSVRGGYGEVFEPKAEAGKPHVNGYESTKDKSRREAHEILTGKKAGNEQRTIDITPSPDLLG